MDRHRVLKTWIAAILWLIVIFLESSNLGSSNNTSRILYPLLHFLFGMDHAHFQHWHFYIRKGGHVFGYGLLSILLFRAWRETLPSIENSKSRRVASELSSLPHRHAMGCSSRHLCSNRRASPALPLLLVFWKIHGKAHPRSSSDSARGNDEANTLAGRCPPLRPSSFLLLTFS
jgi:hypothetical protein